MQKSVCVVGLRRSTPGDEFASGAVCGHEDPEVIADHAPADPALDSVGAVVTAVEQALSLGCSDAAAIRHLVQAVDLAHARSAMIELGALSRFEAPLPVITDYDRLLGQEAR